MRLPPRFRLPRHVPVLLAFATLPLAAAAPETPGAGLVPPASWTWFTPPDLPALRGTWIVGREDAPGLYALRVELAAGGVYVAPANRPHHPWAKDGVVVYQEAGYGPTRNLPVNALR